MLIWIKIISWLIKTDIYPSFFSVFVQLSNIFQPTQDELATNEWFENTQCISWKKIVWPCGMTLQFYPSARQIATQFIIHTPYTYFLQRKYALCSHSNTTRCAWHGISMLYCVKIEPYVGALIKPRLLLCLLSCVWLIWHSYSPKCHHIHITRTILTMHDRATSNSPTPLVLDCPCSSYLHYSLKTKYIWSLKLYRMNSTL